MTELSSRTKILFVLPSLVGGGAERATLQLLTNLDRSKVTPVLVLFERKGVLLESLPGDIEVYDLKKKNRFSLPGLIYRLARLIRDISPALVVSFLIYSNFVTIIARRMSFKNIPLAITEHSVPLFSMKTERGYLLRKWFYKLLYPKAERVITVSEGIKNELISHWNIPSGKIRVIHNAVDLDRINMLSGESVTLQVKKDIPSIIAVGRLSKPKGYPYLLKAIKIVRKTMPVKLLILGEGENKEKLVSLAKELDVFDSVSFSGFKNNPYKYISKSTIFVLSSLWESFSIVLIEAMACGTPIISTRCPYGPEEIITDEINGLLVPVEDESALAEAILKLLDSKLLTKQLVEAGKIRARDFSIERMVESYLGVFEEIMKAESSTSINSN